MILRRSMLVFPSMHRGKTYKEGSSSVNAAFLTGRSQFRDVFVSHIVGVRSATSELHIS